MITRMLATAALASLIALAPVSAAEKDSHGSMSEEMHAQTACPLTGKDINKEIHADYQNQRVYFCCPNCKAAFEKDPAKVMDKLKAEHVKLEMVSHAQTACPLTGEDINRSMYSDVDGRRVYFCCKKCKTSFDSDAETRKSVLKKLADEGVELEKVGQQQSMCPVMGGAINTALYTDADGKRVYFCCAMCKPEFEKDPARYIHEMEARGIILAAAPKGE